MKQYTVSYFENLLKRKRKFTMTDIAKMRPSFIHPYMITGHIDRTYYDKNLEKINSIRKKIMPYSKPLK